jgi:hypothetical protein
MIRCKRVRAFPQIVFSEHKIFVTFQMRALIFIYISFNPLFFRYISVFSLRSHINVVAKGLFATGNCRRMYARYGPRPHHYISPTFSNLRRSLSEYIPNPFLGVRTEHISNLPFSLPFLLLLFFPSLFFNEFFLV